MQIFDGICSFPKKFLEKVIPNIQLILVDGVFSLNCYSIKRQRIPKWQSKIDNPEKLATNGTQDEENQSKNTEQYALDTTMRNQTQITQIRHESSYKQLEVKTHQTSFFMRKSQRTSQHLSILLDFHLSLSNFFLQC